MPEVIFSSSDVAKRLGISNAVLSTWKKRLFDTGVVFHCSKGV